MPVDAIEELQHRGHVENRLSNRKLGARFDLVLEASNLLIQIEGAGIGRDADVEGGGLPDRPVHRCRARD